MKNRIYIKTFNAKKMAKVLEDIKIRATTGGYEQGYQIYKHSISTLITLLEELK